MAKAVWNWTLLKLKHLCACCAPIPAYCVPLQIPELCKLFCSPTFCSWIQCCFQWKVHNYVKKKMRAASEWWVCLWVDWTSVTWAEREGWKKRERGECCLWMYGRLPGSRVSFITLCFNYGCNSACANVHMCVCVSDCEPCVLSCVFLAYISECTLSNTITVWMDTASSNKHADLCL